MMLPPFEVICAYEDKYGDGSFWRLHRRVLLASAACATVMLVLIAVMQ